MNSGGNQHSPASPNPAPPLIPDHRLFRLIGRGSYGEVWLALNAMSKWTAVKIVRCRAETERHAYEQEFRGLQRYDDLSGSDGSLMPIKNVGENVAAGYFYYAMELADDANTRLPLPRLAAGGTDPTLDQAAANYRPWTLSEELKRHGRLSPDACVEYGLALCEALQILHDGGLVHRDVKPSNIIFVNGRPKLADVGLVAATDATMNSFAGTSGFVPLYGAGEPTGDVFALGKVLYMATTGHTVVEFPRAISDLDQLSEKERKARAELQVIYEKACEPMPEERQPSAQALRDELEMLHRNESVIRLRHLESERARAETQLQETRQRRKKLLKVFVVSAAVAICAISALLVYAWRLRTDQKAALADLQASKLSRMLERRAGWSKSDWRRIEQAAKRNIDDWVVSQAVATLAGLDAAIVCEWPDTEVSSVAFSRGGTILVAGYGTNRAALIMNSTNRQKLPVVGEGQACWSADGEPLIWQATSNSLVLREARTGIPKREFPLEIGEKVATGVTSVMAITPDGLLAAAALVRTNGMRVKVWNLRDGKLLGAIDRQASALCFSPGGDLLALGDESGSTRVYETKSLEIQATLPAPKRPNPVNCLAFGKDHVVPRNGTGSPRNLLLAVGDAGAGITVWDLTKRLPRSFCSGSVYNVQSLAFSPDGISLASAGRTGVRMWDLASGSQLLLIDNIGNSDTPALAFNASGSNLFVGSNAKSTTSSSGLVAFDQHRGINRFSGPNFTVRQVWFSPNNQLLAALFDDWSLAVWEIKTGRLRHLFETAGGLADNAGGVFDAAGTRFGFASGHEARLYDLPSGATLEKWALPGGFAEELQFDSKGQLFLARRQKSPEYPNNWRWTLYALPSGKPALPVQQQTDLSYRTISFLFPEPATQFLAITKDRQTGLNAVRAFDVTTGLERWRVDQHQNNVWDQFIPSADDRWCGFGMASNSMVVFARTADGKFEASYPADCRAIGPAGSDYIVRRDVLEFWQLCATEKTKAAISFGVDGAYVFETFAFSPDGKYIAWGTTDGAVMLADIAAVRSRLTQLGKR